MARTISVTGTGRANARPDWVEISITRKSQKLDYDKAVETAGARMQSIIDSLTAVGFHREDLKTVSYEIKVDYIYVNDRVRGQERQFNGYVVDHRMKLSFPLDRERLSSALRALAGCMSHPEFDIEFTVKDDTLLREELLRSAAENALSSARILCAASGVELGQLQSIDYTWGEVRFRSPTTCSLGTREIRAGDTGAIPDFEPDDIDTSESATFVWEIR